MSKFIPLSIDDVEISIFAEQDHIPVRGNAIASGDDDYDKQVEDEIINRLDSGDVWAWASVEVRVQYADVYRSAYLGGCSYADEDDFVNSGYYEDMVQEALDNLNIALASIVENRSA